MAVKELIGICSLVELGFYTAKVMSSWQDPYLKKKIRNTGVTVIIQGPVVQSVVSLMSSLRVISLTVLGDSIHNILVFFAEKM